MQVFFYGIYIHFFISATRNISRREAGRTTILLSASWAMLLLGTTLVVLQLALTALAIRFTKQLSLIRQNTNLNGQNSQQSVATYNALVFAFDIVFALNNLLTDTFYLYRCYVVWGSGPE
ncbi:hypothetical protein B0H11DRAFT_631092 [Mycena galericulata]|nr:hypothetical protein B0H11DRAFT_631092 [Mycena galericulata]